MSISESDLDIEEWSVDDVRLWLIDNGFGSYTKLLCDVHRLDGKALLCISENDLKGQPLKMKVLGDIKRLMICINHARCGSALALHEQSFSSRNGNLLMSSTMSSTSTTTMSTDFIPDDDNTVSQHLDPELWKTALSFVYVFFVSLLTSLVMVIVHDRVPDMEKYPPLPDIFLDNIPYIPWAFEAGELTGLILGMIWTLILVFHKHRFILMRRMFSLMGTIFLLRCVTMLITSLSVPGKHLQCEARPSGDIFEQIQKAVLICRGMGMSMKGVRSCGDYMFSGHTVVLTMFNFFISEYTPRSLSGLHTAAWVLNLFGIFFILSAHEHYSIDVFIAFYITSRIFLYYHTLANNRSVALAKDRKARVWFPLFSFFESRVHGAVPNQFEWPLPWPRSLNKYFERVHED